MKADAQATNLPDLRPNDRVWIQHHQTKEWYKQATVLESRHNGRAYKLLDDEGKTYYRGRRFLRPVHRKENRNEATVNRCYTTKTEEFADTAMESNKLSYAAILSRDKDNVTPRSANVRQQSGSSPTLCAHRSPRKSNKNSAAENPRGQSQATRTAYSRPRTTGIQRCTGFGWSSSACSSSSPTGNSGSSAGAPGHQGKTVGHGERRNGTNTNSTK